MKLRKIDGHVHLIGDGSSGSGCWFKVKTFKDKLLAKIMLREAGLPTSTLKTGMDQLYVETLLKYVQSSDLDAAVLLAQDLPYDEKGNQLLKNAQFYVPNQYVIDLAKKHSEFIPACSIHPARLDALDELNRCIDAGVRVMKLLPNYLNIDYANSAFFPFWKRMAEAKIILLSHTGGEKTVKVYNPRFADPRKLKPVLECGVTVIAAHAAGRSGIFDADWTEDLLSMFKEYPCLFADNSALTTLNRARTLKHVLSSSIQKRIIHGSDFPVPIVAFGPWMSKKITWAQCREIQKEPNVLQRDYLLKNAAGFSSKTFTRLDRILSNEL